MKIIGLIGGLGPESTLDYYRLIIRAFQERKSVDYPEIVVYSANLTEGLKLMEGKNWEALTDWLLYRIEALRKAGAEFAAIGSNSPHVVFDAVQQRSPLPLVSTGEHRRGHLQQGPGAGRQAPGAPGHSLHHAGRLLPETLPGQRDERGGAGAG